jgi:hypothetical protein
MPPSLRRYPPCSDRAATIPPRGLQAHDAARRDRALQRVRQVSNDGLQPCSSSHPARATCCCRAIDSGSRGTGRCLRGQGPRKAILRVVDRARGGLLENVPARAHQRGAEPRHDWIETLVGKFLLRRMPFDRRGLRTTWRRSTRPSWCAADTRARDLATKAVRSCSSTPPTIIAVTWRRRLLPLRESRAQLLSSADGQWTHRLVPMTAAAGRWRRLAGNGRSSASRARQNQAPRPSLARRPPEDAHYTPSNSRFFAVLDSGFPTFGSLPGMVRSLRGRRRWMGRRSPGERREPLTRFLPGVVVRVRLQRRPPT